MAFTVTSPTHASLYSKDRLSIRCTSFVTLVIDATASLVKSASTHSYHSIKQIVSPRQTINQIRMNHLRPSPFLLSVELPDHDKIVHLGFPKPPHG